VSLCSGYVKLEPGTFVGGSKIYVSFGYRTQLADGLLLFAFGGTGTYFLMQLEAGSLLSKLVFNGHELQSRLDRSSRLCDGEWHSVRLERHGMQLRINLDGQWLPWHGDLVGDVVLLSSYLSSSSSFTVCACV